MWTGNDLTFEISNGNRWSLFAPYGAQNLHSRWWWQRGALNNAGCKKVATIKISKVTAQAY